jgi:phospholipid/cholesterol/gamma-HCH transport system ATP-binding protein
VGVEVAVTDLTKSFGRQLIWGDVTLTLPAGEVSVLLGPSGTGKSVFLKSLIGLLKPDKGHIFIRDVDIAHCKESELYDTRKLFGVLFQDGALFGSMNLFDNVAFPLREHTKKNESEVRRIVLEKMDMVGLDGMDRKLPGELSGGMRKRAGLARALVLDPQIILCDEPDSGLDPVRTALIAQLLVDLNAQLDQTILVVTHDISLARKLPDNVGMLFRRELVIFGPREILLTSDHPAIYQSLNGRKVGPIGMSEERDSAATELEDEFDSEDVRGIVRQIQPSRGLPPRQGAIRHRQRLLESWSSLPAATRQGILDADERQSGDAERAPV